MVGCVMICRDAQGTRHSALWRPEMAAFCYSYWARGWATVRFASSRKPQTGRGGFRVCVCYISPRVVESIKLCAAFLWQRSLSTNIVAYKQPIVFRRACIFLTKEITVKYLAHTHVVFELDTTMKTQSPGGLTFF